MIKSKLAAVWVIPMFLCLACSKDKDTDVTPQPETPTTPVSLTKENVKTYIVDKNATDETVALFYNLKVMAKTSFAVGQQDAFDGFYKNTGGMSDIKKTTGNDPALLGSDFMFITDKNNTGQSDNWFYQQEENIINHVEQAYSNGLINIFCWHIREPYKEEAFYVSDMTADARAKAFKSILPGGENHEWYKKKLDKVASVFNNLKGTNGELIPVIFRPFHEYDGSWFWWGADFCTADEFKTAYRFTVDYLKNTKGVHNVLYALSPDNSYDTKDKYLSRYPGDDYVDILGMDNYGDLGAGKGQTGSDLANKKLKIISDLAIEKTKIAVMSETGYQITPSTTPITGWFSNYVYNALTANDIEIAFAMFWGNAGDNYFVPAPSCSNASDFVDFTNKPKALLQNELPDMYIISN
ncbi:MAG TPA: glycosyl hydrolase [Ohtaekwangia sp.]|uniref:glycoside hydrolase family 26 protein n=1 Tax=Ohtaekwangia sp. TaxID=2066019 RepID=UPI002F92DE59